LAVRRGGGPVAAGGAALTARDLWGILRRHPLLLVVTTAGVTAAALALCLALRLTVPVYRSEGLIRCKMPVTEDILQGNPELPRLELIEMQTANQTLYLRSEGFLMRAMDRSRVRETSWYQKRRYSPENQLKDLQAAFTAAPQRNTEFVVVRMEAPSPAEAQLILSEILSQFDQDVEQQATGLLRKNLSALQTQRQPLETQLLDKRRQLDQLRQQAKVPAWEQGRTVVLDELQMMNQEKVLLTAKSQQAESDLRRLLQERTDGIVSGEVLQAIERNPEVLGYRNQIVMMQTRLAGLQARLGPGHPEVKQAEALLAGLGEQSRQKDTELQQQYAAAQEVLLRDNLRSLQAQYEAASSRYDELAAQQSQLDERYAQYLRLQREIEDTQKMLEQFDQRINATRVAIENTDRKRVEVAMPATTPLTVSFPRFLIFGLGGCLLGLMGALGLVFLREVLDDRVRTPSDVARYLQLPLLGWAPRYDEAELGQLEVAMISHTHPQALLSEAYRQVRTNLHFSAPSDELKTLLVTSSSPGEGKTMTAVNLAITFAAEGRRVLLVDANFRRPALNRLFRREGAPRGLSNLLVGHCTGADIIAASEIENLEVADAGPVPPNPAVLLSGERMKAFLESQRSYYDLVILDGPPVLLVTDARVLAGRADGTILVVDAGSGTRGMAQRMIRELRADKVNLVGVVLNGVLPQKGGYFRQTYRTYYEYIGAGGAATLPDQPVAELSQREAGA